MCLSPSTQIKKAFHYCNCKKKCLSLSTEINKAQKLLQQLQKKYKIRKEKSSISLLAKSTYITGITIFQFVNCISKSVSFCESIFPNTEKLRQNLRIRN